MPPRIIPAETTVPTSDLRCNPRWLNIMLLGMIVFLVAWVLGAVCVTTWFVFKDSRKIKEVPLEKEMLLAAEGKGLQEE
ncbi:hypothetical protein AC579_9148 [Pseudocercospora musae]|uniref:Uncharacterized protein n=1 Tax=Pseudocercospora musae TaxID=113226 RepID=A0A139IIH1_9PEZI|nr:hypothetical protein AC579_9148 [Pseudocercospora musae]